MVELGRYKHYKGNLYEVVGEAVQTESREALVIYRSLYDAPDYPYGSLWARPTSMFTEKVTVDGVEVPRFEYIGD